MPNLNCSVYNCNQNSRGFCNLNRIGVAGNSSKENTCCADFIDEPYVSNLVDQIATEYTDVECKATDCVHNKSFLCHADSIIINSCGQAFESYDTECNTYNSK